MTSISSDIRIDPGADSAATSGWGRAVRRHSFIVPGFLIALSVCAWFATWGDGRLFYPEHFCGFYDAQARSILHGHLDVPPEAIGFEAFFRDGKTYGYFGVAPALLRIPLVLLFPGMDGRWSRLLMLVACAVNMLCAYRLVLRMRGPVRPLTESEKFITSLFVICAGIGSTSVFMLSRCYTYHEAIMWGGTFALLFTDCLLAYLAAPRLHVLAAAGVCAFLSFHSRPTAGAGALLALCLLAAILLRRAIRNFWNSMEEEDRMEVEGEWIVGPGRPAPFVPDARNAFLRNHRDPETGAQCAVRLSYLGLGPVKRPAWHFVVLTLMISVTVATYFAVNYEKFRTFDGVPVRLYGMYIKNPVRMQITGGKQFHPENLPTSIASYFNWAGVQFGPEFPWVYMVERPRIIGSPALDVVEPYSSIPLSMPLLALLALAGATPIITGRTSVLRRLRLPAVTLLLGGSIVLVTVGITERYLHDFYPFLIVAAAAGAWRLAARPITGVKAAGLFSLALISIILNCAFALDFQREVVWGVPHEKHDEFVHARQTIDRWLNQARESWGRSDPE